METGLVISLSAIVLLALFAPSVIFALKTKIPRSRVNSPTQA